MSAVSTQPRPEATSQSLVVKPLILRHAEDAAFYWNQRRAKTHSPILRFERLAHFDRLLKAHLDGLRLAAEVGWESALKNLQRWKGAGEAFVAYVLAIQAGDKMRLQALWDVVEKNPDVMQEGLISALGWVREETAVPWMDFWLPLDNYPRLQHIALRAFAVRRLVPGVSLEGFFASPEASVREAACILAGRVKVSQYETFLRAAKKDGQQEVREAAAISLLLLGSGAEVLQDLWQASLHWNEVAKSSKGWAQKVAIKRAEAIARYLGHALPVCFDGIQELMQKLPSRQALIVLAHHGDPATVPWIISAMERKDLARLAGWAFTMIIGIDLDAQRLTGPAPESGVEEERVVPLQDLDLGLSWPNPPAVSASWAQHGGAYAVGTRLLFGRPVSDSENNVNILRNGTQAARWAAAFNIALSGETPYLETCAVARSQWVAMNSLQYD